VNAVDSRLTPTQSFKWLPSDIETEEATEEKGVAEEEEAAVYKNEPLHLHDIALLAGDTAAAGGSKFWVALILHEDASSVPRTPEDEIKVFYFLANRTRRLYTLAKKNKHSQDWSPVPRESIHSIFKVPFPSDEVVMPRTLASALWRSIPGNTLSLEPYPKLVWKDSQKLSPLSELGSGGSDPFSHEPSQASEHKDFQAPSLGDTPLEPKARSKKTPIKPASGSTSQLPPVSHSLRPSTTPEAKSQSKPLSKVPSKPATGTGSGIDRTFSLVFEEDKTKPGYRTPSREAKSVNPEPEPSDSDPEEDANETKYEESDNDPEYVPPASTSKTSSVASTARQKEEEESKVEDGADDEEIHYIANDHALGITGNPNMLFKDEVEITRRFNAGNFLMPLFRHPDRRYKDEKDECKFDKSGKVHDVRIFEPGNHPGRKIVFLDLEVHNRSNQHLCQITAITADGSMAFNRYILYPRDLQSDWQELIDKGFVTAQPYEDPDIAKPLDEALKSLFDFLEPGVLIVVQGTTDASALMYAIARLPTKDGQKNGGLLHQWNTKGIRFLDFAVIYKYFINVYGIRQFKQPTGPVRKTNTKGVTVTAYAGMKLDEVFAHDIVKRFNDTKKRKVPVSAIPVNTLDGGVKVWKNAGVLMDYLLRSRSSETTKTPAYHVANTDTIILREITAVLLLFIEQRTSATNTTKLWESVVVKSQEATDFCRGSFLAISDDAIYWLYHLQCSQMSAADYWKQRFRFKKLEKFQVKPDASTKSLDELELVDAQDEEIAGRLNPTGSATSSDTVVERCENERKLAIKDLISKGNNDARDLLPAIGDRPWYYFVHAQKTREVGGVPMHPHRLHCPDCQNMRERPSGADVKVTNAIVEAKIFDIEPNWQPKDGTTFALQANQYIFCKECKRYKDEDYSLRVTGRVFHKPRSKPFRDLPNIASPYTVRSSQSLSQSSDQ
jgi:hypothetical protein